MRCITMTKYERKEFLIMLRFAIIFFVIAIIAAIFGFGGIASAAAGIAQIIFYLFLVFFFIALIAGLVNGPAAGSQTPR